MYGLARFASRIRGPLRHAQPFLLQERGFAVSFYGTFDPNDDNIDDGRTERKRRRRALSAVLGSQVCRWLKIALSARQALPNELQSHGIAVLTAAMLPGSIV